MDFVHGLLGYLCMGDTYHVLFSWHTPSKEIVVKGQMRGSTEDDWVPYEKAESVSYYVTDIAPHYENKRLYVVATNSNGQTFVERWTIQQDLPNSTVTIQKTTIIEPTKDLTHLRACAVTPNESALIVQRHESRSVERIDLTSGDRPTIVDTASYPNVESLDVIIWQKHIDQRDAYIMRKGRSGSDIKILGDDQRLVIWDHDGDGIPELIEDLTFEEYVEKGYFDENNWVPSFEWWYGE